MRIIIEDIKIYENDYGISYKNIFIKWIEIDISWILIIINYLWLMIQKIDISDKLFIYYDILKIVSEGIIKYNIYLDKIGLIFIFKDLKLHYYW